MDNILCLYTASFPYGKSETFLETEILFLAKKFKEIYIFPYKTEKHKRTVPNNVKIIRINNTPYNREKLRKIDLLNALLILLKDVNINTFKHDFSLLLRYFFISKYLIEYIEKNNLETAIHYTYWFENWATVVSIIRRKKTFNKFISRAHGFDLYDERHKSKIPFRSFQLASVDKLFLISKDGLNYINAKYPKFQNKFYLSYLGTYDFGVSKYNPSKKIKLLSISNLVPVKRIHLIIEALKSLNREIEWTHFGEGPLFSNIKAKSKELPKNISVALKGRVSNKEMLNFIRENSFDMFINVSSSEGLPVSIMEVTSLNIPVIATNVGGTSEIVTKEVGILLEKDFQINILIDSINYIFDNKTKFTPRQIWKEKFSANVNYSNFIRQIKTYEN